MNKALLLSFIFVAVFSSAFAFTGNTTSYCSGGTSIIPDSNVDTWTEDKTDWFSWSGVTFAQESTRHIVGDYSIKITANSGAWRTIYLDFGSVDASGDSYFGFYGLHGAKGTTYDYLRLHTNDTDYYEYDNPVFEMDLSDWAFFSIPKSNFTAVGSPSWDNITMMSVRENPIPPVHIYYIDGLGFYDSYAPCSSLGTESECLMGNCTWGTQTGIYTHGDFVNAGGVGNTSELQTYWVITEQPVQINGYWDGQFAYVGFFPMQDNYTYYVPFGNGTFIYHCNPADVKLDDSIICTGNLIDKDGQAINNALINWELFNTDGLSFGTGTFIFIGNGAYKFNIPITVANNFTTGDYYFKFTSTGFGADYLFPVHLSIIHTQENLLSMFAMIMIVLSISCVIFGYWKKVMGFVIFGAFAMILIAMLMLEEQQLFGAVVSNTFAVIFSLLGLFFLLSMFLQKWKEKREDKKKRIVELSEEDLDND